VPHLILGPHLRYVGEHEATVWVETDELLDGVQRARAQLDLPGRPSASPSGPAG
jgi:hypothetical protein